MTSAERYEELLGRLRFRPHPLRLAVLRALCNFSTYSGLDELVNEINRAGVEVEKEKVRLVLKRLNEAGFLDRQAILKRNKFLFRLKPYEEIYTQVQMRVSRHQ